MASKTNKDRPQAPARAAEIVREYRPFAGADHVHRVTCDGRRAWAATGAGLVAFDPESGEPTRTLDHACDAGTAFDGRYLCQIAEAHIDLIDPATSKVVASIPAPDHGYDGMWEGDESDIRYIEGPQRRSPISSEGARSISSITSCSGPSTRQVVQPAQRSPTASSTTSRTTTSRSAPRGRNETLVRGFGHLRGAGWLRRHDEYDKD